MDSKPQTSESETQSSTASSATVAKKPVTVLPPQALASKTSSVPRTEQDDDEGMALLPPLLEDLTALEHSVERLADELLREREMVYLHIEALARRVEELGLRAAWIAQEIAAHLHSGSTSADGATQLDQAVEDEADTEQTACSGGAGDL
jgi:hypothetical protein